MKLLKNRGRKNRIILNLRDKIKENNRDYTKHINNLYDENTVMKRINNDISKRLSFERDDNLKLRVGISNLKEENEDLLEIKSKYFSLIKNLKI